jgi:hypothetical protein
VSQLSILNVFLLSAIFMSVVAPTKQPQCYKTFLQP